VSDATSELASVIDVERGLVPLLFSPTPSDSAQVIDPVRSVTPQAELTGSSHPHRQVHTQSQHRRRHSGNRDHRQPRRRGHWSPGKADRVCPAVARRAARPGLVPGLGDQIYDPSPFFCGSTCFPAW
jgi:hypothetical protein